MRGLLLTAAVFAICFVAFAAPFAGLLGWGWFTLFAPHQLAWGGVAGISFNDLIAAVTIFGWIFAAAVYGERLLPPNLPISWLFVLFAIWLIVSQLFSLAPELSYPNFERFIIVMVFILLCSALITDKIRIQSMIWVLVLSLALYSIKGALFTIATGGGYHVYGPGRTVIGDNNHFGIAIASILPIIIYLRATSADTRIKLALLLLCPVIVIAVLGTQSRGGFITLCLVVAVELWHSGRRLAVMAGVIIIGIPAILFMPDSWSDRMNTVREFEQDESFQGRVSAWEVNIAMAIDNPLTGAGLRVPYHREIVAARLGDNEMAEKARAAHSSYFEVLGGMGFIGFGLYSAILIFGLANARTIRRLARGKPQLYWADQFGRATQISLVAFMVGTASVSMEMWEGYLLVIVLVNATLAVVKHETRTRAIENPRNKWRRPIEVTAQRALANNRNQFRR